MQSASEMTIAKLVESAMEGDEKAFREIMNRYRPKLLSITLRMLGDKTEAEEAAQDSFVKIYFHLKDFDRSRDFSAWAAGIAINQCRDMLRKRTRSRRIFRELDERVVDTESVSQDENLANKAKIEAVEAAIEDLPEKLREVLVLRAYADYSYEKIAEIMKIKVGTVMSRLYRAREQLTEAMKRGKVK